MSNSLWPLGLQHTRIPCSSPSPSVCSNSCLLSQRCHPAISSSAALFSSCLQSFPASGSFQMSQLLSLGGQNIGASASILPMNVQGWFPLGLTDLTSLQSRELSSIIIQKQILRRSAVVMFQLSHPYMTTGKTTALTRWTFVDKAVPLLFNTLSRFVIAFLLRSKRLLISWLQSVYAVTLEPKKIKSVVNLHYYSFICKVPLLFTNLLDHFIISNFLVMPSIPLLFFKHTKQTHFI